MQTSNYIEVLFVEDSMEDAELTMRSLKKYKLVNEIKLLEDGQQALDYLFMEGEYSGHNVEIPRLVLLDLKLPKVSGLEVLEKMKNSDKLKHIPVVVLTSSSEDNDINKAYELGANSYIVKPVDFNNFAEAIKQIGFYWLILNKVTK